jgi:hypothetical protein
MRNPFRKISPEEEYINNFLKGMKDSGLPSQESRDLYVLIKRRRDEGNYVEAKRLADISLENFRKIKLEENERKAQQFIDEINKGKTS